jgi:zinc transport system ATP-binding protein
MTAPEGSPSPALEVEHLSVAFGATRVLDDLSFRVAAGTSLAIIGPSGAGKTVLFRALIGVVPSTGTIRFAAGTRIGYVPQKLDLQRDLPLTGLDFLNARADVSGVPSTDVTRVLNLVALDSRFAAQPLGTLSGGQFQRLLVAFALMGHPTLLLFDEPTAGIDEPGKEGIYALFSRLQAEEGLTVLIISHELSLVYRYADTVLCLSRWRTFLGPPLDILTPEHLQEAYGAPVRYHHHESRDTD